MIKTTVYVATTDRSDLAAACNEVAAAFAGHDVPSTLLGVAVLGYPHQLVEIKAISITAAQVTPGSQPGTPPRPAPQERSHAQQPLE